MIMNLDFVYPIGSIYISVNATNPSKYFGGTWEQITSDAYLKIVSSDAGLLDGTSSDHKIPVSSMPSHSHTLSDMGTTVSVPSGSYTASIVKSGTKTTNNTGGGEAYYPYYYGVYVFKRTA